MFCLSLFLVFFVFVFFFGCFLFVLRKNYVCMALLQLTPISMYELNDQMDTGVTTQGQNLGIAGHFDSLSRRGQFLSFVSQNTFFPTMPEDNLEEAMAGMRETGSWYRKQSKQCVSSGAHNILSFESLIPDFTRFVMNYVQLFIIMFVYLRDCLSGKVYLWCETHKSVLCFCCYPVKTPKEELGKKIHVYIFNAKVFVLS